MIVKFLNHFSYGDWTPVPSDAVTGGNLGTGTLQIGRYVRIGPLVIVAFNLQNIDKTGMTAGNVFFIQGLPFPAANITNINYSAAVSAALVTFDKEIIMRLLANQSALRLLRTSNTNVIADCLVSDILDDQSDIGGTFIYFTDIT